jgi:hypothetical protein
MLALNSGHTVGDVTTPDLVWQLYCKLTIQMVRDIWPFNGGLLVSVRCGIIMKLVKKISSPGPI